MTNKNIDIFIYFTSKEMKQVSAELLKQLNQVAGVGSVSVNARLKKLLDVSYDPVKLAPRNLLHVINKHGHSATLVGM